MNGKRGVSKHIGSSIIPGAACGFRRRMTGKVVLWFSSRQIFQKARGNGGIAASAPIQPLS